MPDARPLTGLYGKVPAHGDFVRRGLPSSFVTPWDAWLQAGVAAAREHLGAHWAGAWDSAPAWRFALPAGACGPDPVAGVMLPSEDLVGRRFPITLAALMPPGAPPPEAGWFDAVEAAALAGRAGQADADGLFGALPLPGTPITSLPFALPAVPASRHEQEPPAAPWPGADEVRMMPADTEPADDVLDLFGAIAPPPPVPLVAQDGDDALALLIGEAAPPSPTGAAATDTDGTLAGLLGAAAQSPAGGVPSTHAGAEPALPIAEPKDADGTLAALIGDSTWPAPLAEPPSAHVAGQVAPCDTDGVLAALIGAAAADQPPLADPEGDDRAPLDALVGGAADALDAEGVDLLAETCAMSWPDLAEPVEDAVAAPAIAAPPAPEGGGWWTRGGGHVPPMVWPLPGLPSPSDFTYLLEAAA
jgi:type VI secretion system protein ImpM